MEKITFNDVQKAKRLYLDTKEAYKKFDFWLDYLSLRNYYRIQKRNEYEENERTLTPGGHWDIS